MTISKLTSGQTNFFFICLGIATFMVSIDYAIANISIPYIAGDLSVSNDEGTYVITWFAVGNAIGLAMTGWLTKRIGEIKLLLYSIAVFTFFSWACGFSVNLNMLVISRFLQGLTGGPIVPLAQSLIVEYGSPETRRKDLAIWGGIVITAPVLGPIAGGYISYWYSWPWIFYINIPIGIFCIAAIWALMHRMPEKTEKAPGDYLGIALLVIGVSALQIFLDKGQQWDWLSSYTIRALIVTFVMAFIYLFIWEFWNRSPLLNLRLFSISSFTVSILCLMISYAIYFGTIVLIPLWLQQYMGYDAVWAGITVAALGIGPLIFSAFTPMVIKKLGNIRTLILGFIIFTIGCFFNAYFTTAVTASHVAFARFLFGLAFVFYVNPLIGMSVQDIPVDQLPNATGIFHFIRSLIGGIGTAIFKTLWERRTIYHHEIIAGSLTPYNPSTPQIHSQAQLAQLNHLVDQQAALLGINDAFYFMGWCFMGLVVFLFLWYLWTRNDNKDQPHKEVHAAVE
jgi:DHA2 family multidrug resistance protein